MSSQTNDNAKWSHFPQFSSNNSVLKHCTQLSEEAHQYLSVLLSFPRQGQEESHSLAGDRRVCFSMCLDPFGDNSSVAAASAMCSKSGVRRLLQLGRAQQRESNSNHSLCSFLLRDKTRKFSLTVACGRSATCGGTIAKMHIIYVEKISARR